jgi:hypothetical protein
VLEPVIGGMIPAFATCKQGGEYKIYFSNLL